MDDTEWEGCPHGVIEGYCKHCLGISGEEYEKLLEREQEAFRRIAREFRKQTQDTR